MSKIGVLVCLSLLILGVNSAFDNINKDLVNKKIDRKIDISTQLSKISTKITLENTGSAVVKCFLFALSKLEKDKISFFTAQAGGKTLKTREAQVQDHRDVAFYHIELAEALQASATVNVEVEMVLTGAQMPFPASISQGEKQLVIFTGNHYVYSPYTTTTQTTNVQLSSSSVESFSRLKPTTHTDTTLTYGPYEGIAPFSSDEMSVHYENNSPFLRIARLERIIEISHWGNVAIEETVDVYHSGAKLKGPFSRYEYQREHNAFASIKSFKTVLPASATDVYYRDQIGNISTSHLRILEDAVEIDLRPRFPLFGGWKTHYTIGYNVPSYEYMYRSGDNFLLKMRLMDHVFDDLVVEELEVKVIMPEGVKEPRLTAPYSVSQRDGDRHFTYLDTVGRPVIYVTAVNLVENHIQDFTLRYDFPGVLMLLEPLLVCIACFMLFLTVMVWVRLDLTLSRDDATEAKLRTSSHCELVHKHNDKRADLYERLEKEIAKLKSSKDSAAAQLVTKKIQEAIRETSDNINDIGSKLRNDNPEYADKVSDLQKSDKVVRDALNQQMLNAEKLVAGKMNKQLYIDAEANLGKKKEEALEKCKVILTTL